MNDIFGNELELDDYVLLDLNTNMIGKIKERNGSNLTIKVMTIYNKRATYLSSDVLKLDDSGQIAFFATQIDTINTIEARAEAPALKSADVRPGLVYRTQNGNKYGYIGKAHYKLENDRKYWSRGRNSREPQEWTVSKELDGNVYLNMSYHPEETDPAKRHYVYNIECIKSAKKFIEVIPGSEFDVNSTLQRAIRKSSSDRNRYEITLK